MSNFNVNDGLTFEDTPAHSKVIVVGAAGFTAGNLHIPKLLEIGVDEADLILVENNKSKQETVLAKYPQADGYSEFDEVISDLDELGTPIDMVIVASNTAAHIENLRTIIGAVDRGVIDLTSTRIVFEKPVVAPEFNDEVEAIRKDYPELKINVGYILRFSPAITALDKAIKERHATIYSIEWIYGKNRTGDSRPTQGALVDEAVNPLSVTDLMLQLAFNHSLGVVEVEESSLGYRDYVNREVQDAARAKNSEYPEQPVSDVNAQVAYTVTQDGELKRIPVKLNVSFVMEAERRRVIIHTAGSDGIDGIDWDKFTFQLDFDERVPEGEGKQKRVDTVKLIHEDGTEEVIFEWAGDKATLQHKGWREGSPLAATLDTEKSIQSVIRQILGHEALKNA